ncbi:NUDIX domain-containing protein [Streptomyces sp. NPDC002574]|uniref:NUDIX domain-containing protein n=1 Tax=Streptomyces sp. NPDC002574 TaxID=3364652 RepID=UPI0036B4501C
MNNIAENGAGFTAPAHGQDWRVAYCPPPEPPPGTPYGAEVVCVVGDRILLVSEDGQRWRLPSSRPEPRERCRDTMRREVREEACAAVVERRLLGFSRGVCVRGPQEGLVLIRAMWRAEVRLAPWDPHRGTVHRRLLSVGEAFRTLTIPEGLGPFYRKLFAQAVVSRTAVHHL